MKEIWTEIRVFEVTEQRPTDQTRVITTNVWLSKVELDEIQTKIKEEEKMEEPRIELKSIFDQ